MCLDIREIDETPGKKKITTGTFLNASFWLLISKEFQFQVWIPQSFHSLLVGQSGEFPLKFKPGASVAIGEIADRINN